MEPKWIIKADKRLSSIGMSPKSKGNKNDKSKHILTTPSYFDVTNIVEKVTNEDSQMHTDTVLQLPTLFIITPIDFLKLCEQIKIVIDSEELSINSPQSHHQITKLLNILNMTQRNTNITNHTLRLNLSFRN